MRPLASSCGDLLRLAANSGTSVTNAIEQLAAEIIDATTSGASRSSSSTTR